MSFLDFICNIYTGSGVEHEMLYDVCYLFIPAIIQPKFRRVWLAMSVNQTMDNVLNMIYT